MRSIKKNIDSMATTKVKYMIKKRENKKLNDNLCLKN